jgi:hypothetical protein
VMVIAPLPQSPVILTRVRRRRPGRQTREAPAVGTLIR